MPKLKAAAVSFLNAWPLTEGLKDSARIELVLAEPSQCAALLEAGEVDLALLPVGALRHRARFAGYRPARNIWPGRQRRSCAPPPTSFPPHRTAR